MTCSCCYQSSSSWPATRQVHLASPLYIIRLIDSPNLYQMGSNKDCKHYEQCCETPSNLHSWLTILILSPRLQSSGYKSQIQEFPFVLVCFFHPSFITSSLTLRMLSFFSLQCLQLAQILEKLSKARSLFSFLLSTIILELLYITSPIYYTHEELRIR